MPPPQLARDAPGLDVLHPVEEGFLPAFRDDLDIAGLHRFNRFLRELFCVHIPLIGQPRFDHHTAAVPERRCDLARLRIVLDFFTLLGLGDMRDEVALLF